MKFETETDKYGLKIHVDTDDIIEIINNLDREAKEQIAKSIAYDKVLVHTICTGLVDGWALSSEEDEDPWHYFSTSKGEYFEEAQKKLTEMAPKAVQAFVQNLLDERDYEHETKEKYQRLCWRIHTNWTYNEIPDIDVGYGNRRRWTQDEVKAKIEALEQEKENG